MPAFICITCGTQYAPTSTPPAACLICDEERQFVPPSGQDLEEVHQAYVAMAASGIVTEAQSAVFAAVSKRLLNEARVEAIMLGGTDLALAFNERDTDFPLIDCAGIHADAIAKLATA